MTSTWSQKPEDRPSFTYIKNFFSDTIKELVPIEYIELHEKVTTSCTTNVIVHQTDVDTIEQER